MSSEPLVQLSIESSVMNLYLIGYRGTGKSTVGRGIAELLDAPFSDLDDLIESNASKSIAAIFEEVGEQGFRALESEALAQVSSSTETIIALGGGSILRKSNRQILKSTGKCVWLRASNLTLAHRLSRDASTEARRPALTDCADLVEEIENVMQHRLPIYESMSDAEFDTEARTVDEIVRDVVDWWRRL